MTFLNGNEGITAKVNKLYSYHSSEEWIISQSMCRSFFFDFDNKGVYFLGTEKISKNSAIIHFINISKAKLILCYIIAALSVGLVLILVKIDHCFCVCSVSIYYKK